MKFLSILCFFFISNFLFGQQELQNLQSVTLNNSNRYFKTIQISGLVFGVNYNERTNKSNRLIIDIYDGDNIVYTTIHNVHFGLNEIVIDFKQNGTYGKPYQIIGHTDNPNESYTALVVFDRENDNLPMDIKIGAFVQTKSCNIPNKTIVDYFSVIGQASFPLTLEWVVSDINGKSVYPPVYEIINKGEVSKITVDLDPSYTIQLKATDPCHGTKIYVIQVSCNTNKLDVLNIFMDYKKFKENTEN